MNPFLLEAGSSKAAKPSCQPYSLSVHPVAKVFRAMLAVHNQASFSFSGGVLPLLAGIILGVIGPGMPEAAAADLTTPDPAVAALAQLRSADRARTDVATAESTWALERSRLLALIEATTAETVRLEGDAGTAESVRDAARTRLTALGNSSDLDAVRARLTAAGAQATAALATVANSLPPGTIPVPSEATGEGNFDSVVRAVEIAERAASGVAVEVITGERDGVRQAVKVLRVAGAAAWWVALDGRSAGTVTLNAGAVRLIPAAEPQAQAIAAALAQAEGRQSADIALLPVPSTAGGQP